MKIGDEIVWCEDLDDPTTIVGGVVTKMEKYLVWFDNKHQPEDCIYQAYCWPARVKDELRAIVAERFRLKKQYDDSMGLIYQLRNKITLGQV